MLYTGCTGGFQWVNLPEYLFHPNLVLIDSFQAKISKFTIGFDLQPGSLAAQPAGEHQP